MTQEEYFQRELDLREREVELAELKASKSTFWRDAGYVASAVLPVLTFLGLKELFAYKRRRAARRRKK